MANFKKLLIGFLLTVTVLMVLAEIVQATTMTFTVKAGEEVTRAIDLAVEDRVLIKFTVVTQSSELLHFAMIFPNATVKDFGEAGDLSYSFISDIEGECTLRFTNNDLAEDQLVTLNYEVQHYIFGIPQMLFMVIIIVLVCLGAIVVYVFMSRSV